MSDEVDDSSPEPGLQFYWYETKIGEEAGTWWGQLAGGVMLPMYQAATNGVLGLMS